MSRPLEFQQKPSGEFDPAPCGCRFVYNPPLYSVVLCAEHDPARNRVLEDALRGTEDRLADVVEFRHEGKEMATSFFEEWLAEVRAALASGGEPARPVLRHLCMADADRLFPHGTVFEDCPICAGYARIVWPEEVGEPARPDDGDALCVICGQRTFATSPHVHSGEPAREPVDCDGSGCLRIDPQCAGTDNHGGFTVCDCQRCPGCVECVAAREPVGTRCDGSGWFVETKYGASGDDVCPGCPACRPVEEGAE